MFFGHPLERLCTYQYSLVTMMAGEVPPSVFTATTLLTSCIGLLQHLEDCGFHPLATWAPTLTRPTSQNLESQEHDGVSKFAFGSLRKGEQTLKGQLRARTHSFSPQDAFFQPCLPLQQLDMIKESKSWLCGTANSIVAGQKGINLFVDVSLAYHTATCLKKCRLLTFPRRPRPESSNSGIRHQKSQLV